MKNYFIIIFFILIFLPLAILPYTIHLSTEPNEARKLATFPNVHLLFSQPTVFRTYLDSFLSDRIFFRSQAIRLHNYLYVQLLKSSPNKKVMVGKNGWLFYAGDDAFDDFTGKRIFSKSDLMKIMANLESQKEWCDKNQLFFLLIITPNKETVYPEYLPTNVGASTHSTKLDQVIKYFKNGHSDLKIIDLREVMLRNKSQRLLYQKTDSHWNYYGAYYAYREIINNLKSIYPYMSPYNFDAFFSEEKQNSGDLARMLFLENFYTENIPIIDLGKSQIKNKVEYHTKNTFFLTSSIENQDLPKIIMLRDSFGYYLIPFLSNHFRKAIYTLSHTDNKTNLFDNQKQIILKEKPNILIYQITERALDVLLAK